jgi:hypothetical protein
MLPTQLTEGSLGEPVKIPFTSRSMCSNSGEPIIGKLMFRYRSLYKFPDARSKNADTGLEEIYKPNKSRRALIHSVPAEEGR